MLLSLYLIFLGLIRGTKNFLSISVNTQKTLKDLYSGNSIITDFSSISRIWAHLCLCGISLQILVSSRRFSMLSWYFKILSSAGIRRVYIVNSILLSPVSRLFDSPSWRFESKGSAIFWMFVEMKSCRVDPLSIWHRNLSYTLALTMQLNTFQKSFHTSHPLETFSSSSYMTKSPS